MTVQKIGFFKGEIKSYKDHKSNITWYIYNQIKKKKLKIVFHCIKFYKTIYKNFHGLLPVKGVNNSNKIHQSRTYQ